MVLQPLSDYIKEADKDDRYYQDIDGPYKRCVLPGEQAEGKAFIEYQTDMKDAFYYGKGISDSEVI